MPQRNARERSGRLWVPARALAAGALAGASLFAAACESLSDIDRKIEAAIAETEHSLDGGSSAPSGRRAAPPMPEYTADQINKTPGSTNPPPAGLEYKTSPDLPVRERLARLTSYSTEAIGGRVVTLSDAFRIAQESAREYLDAEEEYILSSIRLLIERHLWGPRFFNDTTLTYNNTPAFTGGNYQSALQVIDTLRATQRLPYGGDVEARAIFRATEQLRDAVGDDYTQATQIVLTGNLPLLRGAGLIAQEDLIQAERNVVYAARTFEDFRRRFLVTIATDYFDLVRQDAGIKNQEKRLESVRRSERELAAQVEAGRRRASERRNVEQNVLRSETDLVGSRERYILALDRFKIRLGLSVSDSITLVPVVVAFPEPETTPQDAVNVALRYRLDLQNQRDQLKDAERAVANSRNQLLPELNLNGAVSFNTPQEIAVGGVGLSLDSTVYNASVTLSLPLDREIERLNLRSSIINLNRQARGLSQFEDELVLSVRATVREIDRARFALELQDQSVKINELRLQELIIKSDTTPTQERLDAENELLGSRNSRDSADQDLRVAILNYLTATGLMRVAPDGRFQALPGMKISGEGIAPVPEAPLTDEPADLLKELDTEPALRREGEDVPGMPNPPESPLPPASEPPRTVPPEAQPGQEPAALPPPPTPAPAPLPAPEGEKPKDPPGR